MLFVRSWGPFVERLEVVRPEVKARFVASEGYFSTHGKELEVRELEAKARFRA